MKKIVASLLLLMSLSINAQEKKKLVKTQIVEASCGKCKFGMNSMSGCELAVRINNKFYVVEGSKIDDHGDAHGNEGFCNVIRLAEVNGQIVGNRFKPASFKLKPYEVK